VLDDILIQHLQQTTSKCVFGAWLDSQPEKSKELFVQLMAKKDLNVSSLYISLTKLGDLPFKSTTFKAHVRGDCKCPKP
jgi:hypothetical protein